MNAAAPAGLPAARRPTRPVRVGPVVLGGGAPIAVQSMTSTPTENPAATLAQIERLAAAGCELVRCAVPDRRAARALAEITAGSPLPVIADIHFDHELALAALAAGAAKLRVNPGNLGGPEKLAEVARAAAARGVPIRIGVNAGSLEEDLARRHGGPTPAAMVASARRRLADLRALGFLDVVVSLKTSSVLATVAACRLMAELEPEVPLHLGLTEAGCLPEGAIRSALALGPLLAEGIGDTLRVSLTADPVEEVRAAWEILGALRLRRRGVELVACPTCGRCRVDLPALAAAVRRELANLAAPLTVAVMGCEVNGPGEARAADLGVACGRGRGMLFVRGQPVATVPESEIVARLVALVRAQAAGPG